MTDYNIKRKECLDQIDLFIRTLKNKLDRTLSKEDIAFEIMRQTGFAEKFVITYLDKCIERGIYKEERGLIVF